jgi:hypothetical protein
METHDWSEDGEPIVRPQEVAHYHGDLVRMLFVAAAFLMLVMQFTGNAIFATPAALIVFVSVLVVAAGITSPVQRTIHWINLFLSFAGLAIFGSLATQRLHSLGDFFTHNGITGIIALIFLMALYFSTRTVRGYMTHSNPLARNQ